MANPKANSNNKLGAPWLWVPSLYLAEGIPYFVVTAVSVILYSQLGVPNSEMALYTSLITFPWVIKPLWSPFVDVLKTKRWWVLVTEMMMTITIFLIGFFAPKGYFTFGLILFAITAFASATHDIAADGYYMLALSEKQQSAFVGIRSTFYKIAGIFCQSALLIIVGWLQQHVSISRAWTYTTWLVCLIMLLITLWHLMTMRHTETEEGHQDLMTICQSVGNTFATFFAKPGIALALAFFLLYRLPEALLLKLCNPFFLTNRAAGGLNLSVDQIGYYYGGIGVILMLLGGIIGGLLIGRWGLKKLIIPMALALTLPCAVYVYFAVCQPTNILPIAACIGIEQFGYGVGYTACMMYMIRFAEGQYQTAHFSLCTAFMFLGLMLPGTVAGYIQEAVGYTWFFTIVMITCIPSLHVTYLVYKKL